MKKLKAWILFTLILWIPSTWAIRDFCQDRLTGRGVGSRFQVKAQLKLLPVDLPKSIADSGLNSKQLDLIRSRSQGMIDIYELIRRGPKQGYLLGVTDAQEVYAGVAKATGLTDWEQAYYKLGIERDEKHHTERFMDDIAKSNLPIVFLVPSHLWSHPSSDITKAEMEWLLKRPEVLSRVLFVFGALDIIDQKSWMEVMLSDGRYNLEDQSTYSEKKALMIAETLKRSLHSQ